jgi:hypothetical protein
MLTFLEYTQNIRMKTERETKIKSQRVTILLKTAGETQDKFGKRP